jgi:glycosyltransferase involved in cell wall biosynthesis
LTGPRHASYWTVNGSQVPVTVVIATRDRAAELSRTLGELSALDEQPHIIVVDNGSSDATAAVVRDGFPAVRLIRLPRNQGAAARNIGVAQAATEYVAFSDDDSWWEPGALRVACDLLGSNPALGLIAGRTLVGPDGIDDPLNAALAASPLPGDGLPGPRVLGFLGCACVTRRTAFGSAGGYCALLGVGGEEELLAMDLAAAGWAAAYVDKVVARHFPSTSRNVAARRAVQQRNPALIAWMRRPPGRALAVTAAMASRAAADPVARRALAGLLRRLPRAIAARRRLPAATEAELRLLEDADGS